MNKIISTLSLAIILTISLKATTVENKSEYSLSLPSYHAYTPDAIHSVDQFPDKISRSARQFIDDHFSADSKKSIHFKVGCLINREKIGKTDIAADFYLVYTVDVQTDLLESYDFCLYFDNAGRVLNSPEIPNGECGRGVKFLTRKQLAEAVGIDSTKWYLLAFEYSKKHHTFTWRVGLRKEPSFWLGEEKMVFTIADACSGRVLEHREAKILH